MNLDNRLIQAFEELNYQEMKSAIDDGANVNCSHPDGGSLLSYVVDFTIDSNIQAEGRPGDEDISYISLLLNSGADINLSVGNNSSALECAKSYKHAVNIVAYLESFNS